MQSPSVQFIPLQPVNPQGTNQTVLKDGDSVFVRVLQANQGSYLVSFAGNRYEVQSERTLFAGEEFFATVKISAQKLFIIPTFTGSEIEGSSSVMSQLESLGLPPQALSLFLVQFMEQTGVKINVPLANRALSVASRYPGKEKKVSEIAIMLLNKGLEPTDEAIANMLYLFYGEDDENQSRKKAGEKDLEHDKNTEDIFLDKVFPDGSALKNQAGLLTLVNQTGTGDRHWFFLPYEWDSPFYSEENGVNKSFKANGIMRFLLDTKDKTPVKLVADCKTLAYNHFFVLYYKEGSVSKIQFYSEPVLKPKEAEQAQVLLSSLVHAPAFYTDSAFPKGAFTLDESLASVDGVF